MSNPSLEGILEQQLSELNKQHAAIANIDLILSTLKEAQKVMHELHASVRNLQDIARMQKQRLDTLEQRLAQLEGKGFAA